MSTATNTEHTLMDTVQAAKYLGVTPRTLRALARDGRVPSARVGKARRYLREALEDWIRRQMERNGR